MTRANRGVLVFLTGVSLGAALVYELETSALQARLFTRYAQRLSFDVQPGASDRIAFPTGGPLDERRGYIALPQFQQRLEAAGFRVAAQARVTPELARLVEWGIAPPYPVAPVAGLVLRAADGERLHDATRGKHAFADYADVPPLIVDTLVFIENQELLEPLDPRTNPTLEWDRLAKASLLYFGSKMGLPVSVEGGSTLATQLEKFRHSPHGRTDSARDKIRQITAASLKAYQQGADTTARRREIVVEYLNTMPLAAAPGYGEVYGLGEGLQAWFGLDWDGVDAALRSPEPTAAKVRAYKHALALLAALPAPTTLLRRDRPALERRMAGFLRLLAERGLIDGEFAARVRDADLEFLPQAPVPSARDFVERKAATAIRARLLELLGVSSLYELDQIQLEVDTTIDADLQEKAVRLFRNLAERDFVRAHGLNEKRLLLGSDPENVHYSLLLFERTEDGNLLRVQTDNLDQPFDVNRGVKMELGSTAKLRTMAHYLELVAALYEELRALGPEELARRARAAHDPITRWAAEETERHPDRDLDAFLDAALERRYSASPWETFFTGGGVHRFENFDRDDNGRTPTVREAFHRSTNLVFIRLMRDLVRFHEARLPYDAKEVIDDPDSPVRRRLLEEIAETESRRALARALHRYQGLSLDEAIAGLLGSKARSARHLAVLFYAWHEGGDEKALAHWLEERGQPVREVEAHRLARAYGNPNLNISDYGYLLSRHPLEVWLIGVLQRHPDWSLDDFLRDGEEARRVSSAWLFKTRNRRAQDRRLRIRVESDAFARMAPYWQRLGFPFARLVPSYATAIGSSGDRPAALAELMGIVVNDGLRRPSWTLRRLQFARGTPWESVFEPAPTEGERVLDPTVAQTLRELLAGVVERGTARRVAGSFRHHDGSPATVGGKTGTGDNRFETFHRGGGVRSSKALNRTATFVFFVEDRYFGVLSAFVLGREAEGYGYTSSLPLAILKLLAPDINQRLDSPRLEMAHADPAASSATP